MTDRLLNELPPNERERPGMVYFAFNPAPDVADYVVSVGNRLRTQHRLMGTMSPAVLHVTICEIGHFPELPDERIGVACKIAKRVIADPIEIMFDRIRTYENGKEKSPLVAFASRGMPAFALFRRSLIADLRLGGFIFTQKLPAPHMTLLYDRCIITDEPIDPIRWVARNFRLTHSIHGEGRHSQLGEWPLCG